MTLLQPSEHKGEKEEFGATTFNTFDLQIFADRTLVGRSTGLITGTTHLVPDSAFHASGDFTISVRFAPVGEFFSSNIQTAELKGLNDSYTVRRGIYFL